MGAEMQTCVRAPAQAIVYISLMVDAKVHQQISQIAQIKVAKLQGSKVIHINRLSRFHRFRHIPGKIWVICEIFDDLSVALPLCDLATLQPCNFAIY